MKQNKEQTERVKNAIRQENLDALICALPSNVLMLTGYFPVVGTSTAIFTREGEICLLAPKDEKEFAEKSFADEIRPFIPGSLAQIGSAIDVIKEPLFEAIGSFKLKGKRVGCEWGAFFQPASYASMHFYGAQLFDLLETAGVNLAPADRMLARLRAVKTPFETERIRAACRIARTAYETGKKCLQPGLTEREIAAIFRTALETLENSGDEIQRTEGFVFCAAGENSAKADAAYQRSRAEKLKENEFVLVHCNSHADGFWTDITRTYLLDGADEKKRWMYRAVLAARDAALEAIRPGAKASDVDRAARAIFAGYGFSEYFTHGTGHEVGFAAINHDALPRIHPASIDVLETGMTFNVEPAVYMAGAGGVRHCEMVAVSSTGAEILTPFHTEFDQMFLSVEERILSSLSLKNKLPYE